MNFIYENLPDTKIDISIVLNSKEDRHICNSPQDSFEKYIENAVINVVCSFFERIYKSGMLFNFDMPKLLQFYKRFYDVKIISIIYEQTK